MTIPEIPSIPDTLTPIQHRENEIAEYTKNIATYQNLLSKLNGIWDSDLVQLKDIDPHLAAKDCPIDRIERFAELVKYEQFSHLLKTEIIERSKAQSILDHLVEIGN